MGMFRERGDAQGSQWLIQHPQTLNKETRKKKHTQPQKPSQEKHWFGELFERDEHDNSMGMKGWTQMAGGKKGSLQLSVIQGQSTPLVSGKWKKIFHCCGKIKVLKLHMYIRQEVKTNCRTDTGTFKQLLLGLCIWLQNAWSKKAWQMFKTFYSALQKKKKKIVMWLRALSVTSDMFEEGQWCHWGILWMEWRAQVCCPNNLRTWLGLNNERVLFPNKKFGNNLFWAS